MKTTILSSLLVGLVATSLSACDSDLDGGSHHAIFVRQAIAPPTDGVCKYVASPTLPALLEGVVDVGVRDDYYTTLLVASSESGPGARITDAHVTVRTPEGALLREFEAVVSGFVEGGGVGLTAVPTLDAPAVAQLSPQLPNRMTSMTVIAEIELRGRGAADDSLASTPVFRFPVKVCKGCLVNFEGGNDPAHPEQPNCLLPLRPDARKPCFPGQDEPVSCQHCQGSAACDPRAAL